MTDNIDAGLDIRTDSSLSKKVSKGALWVTAGMICSRILNFARAIIVTRLLIPEDFGLMAMAMAVLSLMQGTTQTGFESAIIQKQEQPEEFLNTAWTFELIRHLALFLIIFLSAPLLAVFFRDPRATIILRVISLSLIFQGFRNIGVVYFKKNIEFDKQFILGIVPLAIGISVVIPLAFILRNVWALVFSGLASALAVCIVSYILHPYRPRLDFNLRKANILFGFGKWILGASILVMIREQGITMFVGRFFGMSTLGFYNRAEVFSKMLFQQMSELIWMVGYPAYSQLQTNQVRLKRVYLKTSQLLTFIGMPMAGGLFVMSGDFVTLFLTDKWFMIVPIIRIFCLLAMFSLINTPAGIVFQAVGKPAIGTKISVLGVIILAIVVYPLSSQWGISGTAFALLLSVLLTSPIIWFKAIKILKCSALEFFKPILFPVINTCIMIVAIIAIKKHIFLQVKFGEFFGVIVIGITIYAVIAIFFDRCMNYGMLELIKERVFVFRREGATR